MSGFKIRYRVQKGLIEFGSTRLQLNIRQRTIIVHLDNICYAKAVKQKWSKKHAIKSRRVSLSFGHVLEIQCVCV